MPASLDLHLLNGAARRGLRACLVAGLFFGAAFLVPRAGPFRLRQRRIPLAFVLIGSFSWLAENISPFWPLWSYPSQLGAWSAVHASNWGSWSRPAMMTFTILAHCKHIKASIDVPE
jgi:uncharacterized membrane protein YoaT (DUF817 family)